MSRAKTEPGTPNGIRRGTASIPATVAEPSLRVPLDWRRILSTLVVAGLLGLCAAGWATWSKADNAASRADVTRAVRPLDDRLRAVESEQSEQRGTLREVLRGIRRLERAAGVAP
jgi:hypothetical protein